MRKLVMLLLFLNMAGCSTKDWRTASRESAGIAPDPASTRQAVLQVYGATAWGWRGWFAIHTWIASKPTDGAHYTVYEVVGWRQRQGLPVVRIEKDLPDRLWYGERPRLLEAGLLEGQAVRLADEDDEGARSDRGPAPGAGSRS